MKIVKCLNCGKYIHKTNKCFHCGNTDEFEQVESGIVHENVRTEYARMEYLIDHKKYDDVIALSDLVLEWMPNLAGVFWLRLLAKNKCTSALDLISKGFSCEDDADFYNALHFSDDEEHSVYVDIQNIVNKFRNILKREIINHEYNCKLETKLLQIKKGIQREMDSRKDKLFTLWSTLEEIEHSLYVLEMDIRLIVKEYQTELEKASQTANSLNSEVSRMTECGKESMHAYQVKLESVFQQSEQAKDNIESLKKQHPSIKSFTKLLSERDKQKK